MASVDKRSRSAKPAPIAPAGLSRTASSRRAWLPLAVPFCLAVGIALVSLLPRIQQNAVLVASFCSAALLLVIWAATLLIKTRLAPAASLSQPSIDLLLRPQHYVQAAVQLSVYVYWGYFYRPVYEHALLIVAQLLFAYGFDMLLTWSRREKYVLGFGAFPIVFSTNLFLWFKDDWFYLQFLMIAVGFMGKEFVRWQRDGKSTHIFNPSAFTLGLFSLILIATGTSDLTWGQEIASTLTLAPYIYLFLFGIGLVVMYCFSITLVAGTAAAVLFALSTIYAAITGVPYFLDSDIPAAVFLGLHLLVTDPSTSPRTPLGKAIFGALYGLGVFGLYWLLNAIGAPTFYDKLLCVPLLNLSVIGIDRFVQRVRSTSPGAGNIGASRWSNPLHMAVWALFFGAMTASGKTDGKHTGDSLPFWEQACNEGRAHACERLIRIETSYCGDHSPWACNELGTHFASGTITPANPARAQELFAKSCELRFQAACINLLQPQTKLHAEPQLLDLRLLLREGGKNLMAMPEHEIYLRACDHGFSFACGR